MNWRINGLNREIIRFLRHENFSPAAPALLDWIHNLGPYSNQDVFHQRVNDSTKGGANDDTDRQIDGVALDREFFEFLPHMKGFLSVCDDVDKLFRNHNHLANR